MTMRLCEACGTTGSDEGISMIYAKHAICSPCAADAIATYITMLKMTKELKTRQNKRRDKK